MNSYQEISAQFYGNRLLFGDPAEPGIVAVEIAVAAARSRFSNAARATRNSRAASAQAVRAARGAASCCDGFRGAASRSTDLTGDFRYRHARHLRPSRRAGSRAAPSARDSPAKPPASPDAPYFVLTDPVEQYLMLSGTTYFIGMEFGDLRRLQLDIETYISPGFEFPTAAREGDRIIAIALSDSAGFERVLRGDRDGRAHDARRAGADRRRARPRRDRGPQPVSFRPRIPGGARPAPSGEARARTRRQRDASRAPRACRSPSARSRIAATTSTGAASSTPGFSRSTTISRAASSRASG